MFAANEKNGPYVSDESFKMATTDAIGTAAKMIGLASDVYMGLKNKNIPNQTKYPTQNNSVQDEKPWLNKADFDKAQEYLRNGGKLEVIKAKYRISKEMMENLNQVINQAIK